MGDPVRVWTGRDGDLSTYPGCSLLDLLRLYDRVLLDKVDHRVLPDLVDELGRERAGVPDQVGRKVHILGPRERVLLGERTRERIRVVRLLDEREVGGQELNVGRRLEHDD